MNNSYLVELIKSLSPKIHSEIGMYLSYPLYNSGKNAQDVCALFQAILDAAPEFQPPLITKEVIYPKVFLGQKFIQGKLEKLMVDLNKQIRNFILIKKLISSENEDRIQLEWITWLREEGLTNRAQKHLAHLNSTLEKSTEESLFRLKLNLLFAEEEHELESIQNQFNNDLSISKLTYALDLFYHNYKLELYNRYSLQQKVMPLPDLEQNPSSSEFWIEKSILFRISNQIRELLVIEKPSTDAVYVLMDTLQKSEKILSSETKAQYYAFLRNLCTILINVGQIEFAVVLHKIHLDNLQKGLFFIKDEIAPHAYMSIVHIAIQVHEAEWALDFTNGYKLKLIGGDPHGFFYKFNLSKCLFALKRYDEAITNLPDPSLHLHYQGTIRCLELKIYYEMQSDLLLYKMYAFRKYFERTATKTVSATLRTMYIEFFNIMLQLTQSPPKDKKRSQQLIDRINKKKLLADRAWLLEKARELG